MMDKTPNDTTVRIRIRRVLGEYEFLESEAEHTVPKGAPLTALGEVRTWLATQLDPEIARAAATAQAQVAVEERPADENRLAEPVRTNTRDIPAEETARGNAFEPAPWEAAAEPAVDMAELNRELDAALASEPEPEPEPELTPDQMRERIRGMIPQLTRSMGAQAFVDRWRAVVESFGLVPGQRIPDEHLHNAIVELETMQRGVEASG